MTLKEKKSKRKAVAIRYLVENGEYSAGYASMVAEGLNDEGKLLDVDYEPLAEWLDELMQSSAENTTESVENPAEEENLESGVEE